MNAIKEIALNGILMATIAHGAIGLSLVWDKVLLQKKGTQNLVSYVFWLGAISIFAYSAWSWSPSGSSSRPGA
jgi:hypothetical protein